MDMRASDVERLRERYHTEDQSPDLGPMRALGVDIPRWKQLGSDISPISSSNPRTASAGGHLTLVRRGES
jgi:hypothetical protein